MDGYSAVWLGDCWEIGSLSNTCYSTEALGKRCLRISAVRGALGIASEYSFNKGTTYPPISLLSTYTVNGG